MYPSIKRTGKWLIFVHEWWEGRVLVVTAFCNGAPITSYQSSDLVHMLRELYCLDINSALSVVSLAPSI